MDETTPGFDSSVVCNWHTGHAVCAGSAIYARYFVDFQFQHRFVDPVTDVLYGQTHQVFDLPIPIAHCDAISIGTKYRVNKTYFE